MGQKLRTIPFLCTPSNTTDFNMLFLYRGKDEWGTLTRKLKLQLNQWYWVDQSRLLTEKSRLTRRLGLSRPNEFFQQWLPYLEEGVEIVYIFYFLNFIFYILHFYCSWGGFDRVPGGSGDSGGFVRVTGGSGKVPGRFRGFQAVPGGFWVLQTTQSAQCSFVFRSFTPREFTVSSLGKGLVISFSQRQGVNGSANAAFSIQLKMFDFEMLKC